MAASVAPTEILRNELERLFDLEALQRLSRDLLGLDPDDVARGATKGVFARALVDRCLAGDMHEALADAIALTDRDAEVRLRPVYEGRPADDLAPGTLVESFKVVKKTHDEGFGAVYLATGAEGRQVTLKVLREGRVRDRRGLQRFLLAQRALRAVEHPAVQRILAAGVLPDGRPYIAAEYIDGQLLSVRLGRAGAMHINEARNILQALTEGLDRVHAAGLSHADIRPDHVVLVRRDGALSGVLVDFGVDRLMGARTGAAPDAAALVVLPGGARALAPERARLGTPADVRSDVYALGALTYEVLTGRPVFTASSPVDLIVAHVTQAPEAPSRHAPRGWVTRELDAVVLRALAKAPEERYPSAGQFYQAVVDALKGKRTGDITREEFDARKAAVAEAPGDDDRALALEQSGSQGIPWADVALALREAADAAEDPGAKKGLRFRVARVFEAEVKDLAAARGVYAAIAEADPADEVARSKVQEIRRATATPDERAEMLLEEVEGEALASEKARLLVDLSHLYEREIKDPDNALVALTEAVTHAPADDLIATEVERLAGDDAAKWADVLSTVAGAAKGREPGDAVALLLRAGRWYLARSQRPDFALACYTQALAVVPGHDGALEGSAEIYRRAQQWPELAAVLLKRADALPVASRARDLRAEAAELLEGRLNDPRRGREILEKVLTEDPTHARASELIERIYLRESDWKGLVGLLERKAAALTAERRADALDEIAEVYEDRLADPVKAAEYFEQAREADPRNMSALKGLERLYARAGDHEKLLRTLEAQLGAASTPRQKVELLNRTAALVEEEFVDHARASRAYEEALAIDPANDTAMTGLGRLYRVLGRWDDLVALLEKHADLVTDSGRKVDLLLAAGRSLLDPVGSIDRAARAFERAAEIDRGHPVALEHLARIAALRGDTRAAAEAYDKLAQAARTPAEKVEVLLRVGRVLEEKGDRDGAIERYKRALDADPESAEATGRLRSLYAARGDAAGAIEMLQRQIEAAEGSNARAALWVQVARTYRERLKDKEKARDAAQKATLLDGTNDEAGALLGEIVFEEGDFAEAARLLGPRAARVRELDRAEGLRLALQYGEALSRAGDADKALEAFRAARDIAPEDREVLASVAQATYGAKVYAEARSLYDDLLKRHGRDLDGNARVDALWHYADAARRTGDPLSAGKALAEAHELDPQSARVVELAATVAADEGRWDEVAKYRRKRVELTQPESARFEMYLDLGEVLATRLGEKNKAARAYVSALEIKPDDRRLLMKLMQLYSDERDWGRLVEIILRLADLVEDRGQLARYYLTAAQLCDVQLGRADEAIDYYEQALEQDATLTKALDGIAALRTARGDFTGLEQSYRRVLARLPEGAPKEVRARLHARLGAVFETQLHQPGDAVAEYERAMELAPGEFDFAEKLAELYLTDTKRYFERAVTAHRALLTKNPIRLESLRALRRAFTEAKRPDEAWCLCQALVAARAAEPEEENFYKKFRTDRPAVAQEKLTEERWARELAHPLQDTLLTSVFATITPAVLASRGLPLERYGLSAATKIDPATDTGQMAQTIHYAAGVLGLKTPSVHALATDDSGINFALTDPPGLYLGATALAGGPAKALAFLAGNRLAYFRPGHFVRQIVPTGTGLRAWLFAAIRAVQPTFPIAADLAGPVGDNVAAIKQHLSASALEVLTSLVSKLVQSDTSLDLKRWTVGVDLTADRAAFLLANDLSMTLAVVRATPDDAAGVPQADRIRELRLFAVSEEYFHLRQRLGIAMVVAS